jgi:hypothetical protein
MSFETDPTTVIGMIRLKIADLNPQNPIFTDTQLNAFYLNEGLNIKRASAAALEAIAVNEILVLKVIKNLQLSTDGARVGETLLKTAEHLRAQAAFDEDAQGGFFDIAEQVFDPFTFRERVQKQKARQV